MAFEKMKKIRDSNDYQLEAMLGLTEDFRSGLPIIPFNQMRPYRGHKFHLYSGDRLNDMVESIKENGILVPPIVWELPEPIDGMRYEILAGHNRINAATIAGLTETACVVKTDLTEREARTYVRETNILQRSFSEMLPSEQAAVIAERYEDMRSQGKRNDIQKELEILENSSIHGKNPTCCLADNKLKSSDRLGQEYNLSSRTIARWIWIDKLVNALKIRLDEKKIDILAGEELSFLSEEQQNSLEFALLENPQHINLPKAKQLRLAAKNGTLSLEKIQAVLAGKSGNSKRPKLPVAKIKPSIYTKYFPADTPIKEIEAEISKALDAYFSQG